ncbi:MAG: hypothetical protein FWD69_16670 [Polyangiaceae bacterium]|nr:hypothetical protein [Polyangiaceae bacterium]
MSHKFAPIVLSLSACSSATSAKLVAHHVDAAPPPKDDGKEGQGGRGGEVHAAALEQLKTARISSRNDNQRSVLVPLPDAANWTRVKFATVKSLVGFRYGKDHHAIVAAFVTHVEDNTALDACNKSFETWASPWVTAFDVELRHDPPSAFSWSPPLPKVQPGAPRAVKTVAIVDVDSLFAKTATVLSRESYAGAWAAYPAWDKACLIVGVAVPARDEDARARDVRDRFVAEVLPKLVVTTTTEPKARY